MRWHRLHVPERRLNPESVLYCRDSDSVAIKVMYSDALAHLIYAAADIVLVPSMFEPCGLTQLVAMRCGRCPAPPCSGCCAALTWEQGQCRRTVARWRQPCRPHVDIQQLCSSCTHRIRRLGAQPRPHPANPFTDEVLPSFQMFQFLFEQNWRPGMGRCQWCVRPAASRTRCSTWIPRRRRRRGSTRMASPSLAPTRRQRTLRSSGRSGAGIPCIILLNAMSAVPTHSLGCTCMLRGSQNIRHCLLQFLRSMGDAHDNGLFMQRQQQTPHAVQRLPVIH
jgi:hypothetical protein